MDTTPKYVKMCEKAEEIQKIYQEIVLKSEIRNNAYRKLLGWYVARYNENITPGYSFIIQHYNIYGLVNWRDSLLGCTWLPTQDQLQKMVKMWNETETQLLQRFASYIDYSKGNITVEMDDWSLERLWLAFVMREKYGKHWDNEKEDWVK